jgi:hypothetical protein
VHAQRRGRAEPGVVGYAVDREVGGLEEPPGQQDALGEQPLVRRGAGGLAEAECRAT